ncbi:MAG: hypothetical protein GY729_21515, partial [Desulfobacteraceae bacterium]|nr:hypothetical protein [Desulfobacteraceae bacterium]
NFHGDNRLLVTITTSQIIRVPKKSSKTTNDFLSKTQLNMYLTQAEMLCEKKNRDGIWLGLFFLGVNPNQIKEIQYLNGNENKILYSIRSKLKTVNCPGWLMNAIKNIPDNKWRINRNTIGLGMRNYGTSYQHILKSVKHHNFKLT